MTYDETFVRCLGGTRSAGPTRRHLASRCQNRVARRFWSLVFVFCSFDGTLIKRFDSAWRRIWAVAGLDDFDYHDLRPTSATHKPHKRLSSTKKADWDSHNPLNLFEEFGRGERIWTSDPLNPIHSFYGFLPYYNLLKSESIFLLPVFFIANCA